MSDVSLKQAAETPANYTVWFVLQVTGSRQGIAHTVMIRVFFYIIIYYRNEILPRMWVM